MDENKLETTEENETKTPDKKKPIRGYVIEFLVYLVLIYCCIYIVPKYVIQRTVVKGESMENTLHTGESLLVEKVSRHFTDPARYDIIVFHPDGEPEDEFYVKRVFGLPGEKIQIIGNDIYINDKKIKDGYGKTVMAEGDEGTATEPIILKDNEFFVLGDNREVSIDSREEGLGPIKRNSIVGRSLIRIWPLDKFGIPD